MSEYVKKGQMFIIASLFVLIGMIIIFNTINVTLLTEERKFQEVRTLDKSARNIFNEYRYAMGIATLSPAPNQTAILNLANLSDYIRDETDSEIFYAVVFINGTNQRYSVNIGNYLDTQVNVTINVTDSSPSTNRTFMNDRTNSTFQYTANITSGTINVTISYKRGSEDTADTFPFTVSPRNVMEGYFDIKLYDSDGTSFVRIKETYNRTW